MNSEEIKQKLKLLKSESGSHSPSIETMLNEIPELKIKVDACFLSNPYATDLFMQKIDELYGSKKMRDIKIVAIRISAVIFGMLLSLQSGSRGQLIFALIIVNLIMPVFAKGECSGVTIVDGASSLQVKAVFDEGVARE